MPGKNKKKARLSKKFVTIQRKLHLYFQSQAKIWQFSIKQKIQCVT